MNIAEKLKKLRESKGISQNKLIEELAEKQNVNVAISSIRNYENINSPRIPQGEVLLALARYYDVNLEYLIDDNITTYKKENLDIGKNLSLTDEVIDSIYEFKSLEQIDIFNEFVSNDIMYNLLPRFKAIKELTSFIYHTRNIILLISDGMEVKNKFDINYLDEKETNKFIEYIRDKSLTLKKFIIYYVYKNTSLFDNTKQGMIFKMFDFNKCLSGIFRNLSFIDEKYKECREDYNRKNKDLNNVYEKIIREYYIVIFQNLKSIKVALEAYRDILIYNLSDIFSDYLKYELLAYDDDFEKIVNKYNNIKSMKITTYVDDDVIFEKEISVEKESYNVSKRDSKE